ncbi:hypothetical protein L198_06142 [Cryptococcus wingfieldii CBS 7118]|uniref:THUMP domain-containing protein n=1 Tax=Cryptococcus wingfieldii CBS 7118 TaxID=1295528 RepID=A0A1E3IQV4_9TREE|nr:hypothetical protein L198_06142 [Cryptococcus wingfieldii CBS 7118]ODN90825.1 hypothetical protein L198_06142 [Cryptococcus wingfieldii CBS 7118]
MVKSEGTDNGRSAQRNKYYKFDSAGRGRGGGRGGRGGRGGKPSGPGREPLEDKDKSQVAAPEKVFVLTKYREKPLPEMITSPGIFISTTKDREKAAELELLQYLETIADELYPETAEAAVKPDEEMDFEEMLKKDLDSMKEDGEKSKRFRLCLREGFCLLYVNVLPPLDPHRIVRYILEQAESTGKYPLKHCKRLVPIPETSGATLKQLSDLAAKIVKPAFDTPDHRSFKFAIDTNSRHSEKLERLDMIKTVAEQVTNLGQGHVVDLKKPEKSVIVEVYKNNLGVTVLEDFDRFKKYNPGSVATQASLRLSKAKAASISNPAEPSTSTSTTTSASGPKAEQTQTPSKAQQAHERSRRRASQIAHAHPSPSAEFDAPPAKKTKTETGADGEGEGEDGEWMITEKDVEKGELVEGENGEQLGDGFEEVIEGGKVLRYRKDDSSV